MIWTVPILFALGSAVSICLAARSRDPDAILLSWALAAYIPAANMVWYYAVWSALPVMDWMLGIISLVVWATRREKWVLFFTHCIAARLVLHVLDFLTVQQFHISYLHGINLTFAIMLALVANTGMGDAASDLLRGLRRLRASLSTTRA